jgi:hypothetical protein
MAVMTLSGRLGGMGIAVLIFDGFATPATGQNNVSWNHNIFGPKREVTAGMEAAVEPWKREQP